MTVENTSNKQEYTGDGVTTGPYIFNFQTLEEWIFVYVDGVIVSDTTYTLTVNEDQEATPGGFIDFDVAVADQLSIIILRTAPLTQLSDYVPFSAFPSGTVENDFDKSTIINQQQQEEIDRTLRVGFDSEINPIIPEGEALSFWRWDATGLNVEYVDLSASGLPSNSDVITYTTKTIILTSELDDLNVRVGDNETGITDLQTDKADLAGDSLQTFDVAAPTTDDHAIRRIDYAATNVGGTIKTQLVGNTFYLTFDGSQAGP